MASTSVQIELTEKEQELFELLLASIAHSGAQTVVRVAGGWVRDKVLRQQSCDIDVALNDQSGVEFANHVNDYLKHVGLETRTIAVIQVSSVYCPDRCVAD
jgi:tRNA nucleotidyltransferase/poly(A) polymerase